MHTGLVQLMTRVLKRELPEQLRMLPRKRQSAGPLLDEGEVPESVRRGGLVPLCDRAQTGGKDEPCLVDPPGSEEAMAPGHRRCVDRAGVAGTSRMLRRALRQRERLRLALVEADDGERASARAASASLPSGSASLSASRAWRSATARPSLIRVPSARLTWSSSSSSSGTSDSRKASRRYSTEGLISPAMPSSSPSSASASARAGPGLACSSSSRPSTKARSADPAAK